MKSSSGYRLALFLGFFILLADALSKLYVHQYLPMMNRQLLWYPYGGLGVFKDFFGIEFSITHATNRGAAWGILANWQHSLLYLRIALIAAMLIYTCLFNKKKGWTIPFFLIIAGAIGNVLDFFFYGHVVDMLHFKFWDYDYPVFNVADSAIFIGIAWLLFSSFREKSATKKQFI